MNRGGVPERIDSLALYFTGVAISAMAASVSLAQSFMVLALLFSLPGIYRGGLSGLRPGKPWMIAGILFFFWIWLEGFVRSLLFSGSVFDLFTPRMESSDLALFLFGMLVYRQATESDKNKNTLFIFLYIFIAILVLSGVVALFFEFRLSNLIRGRGFSPSALNRPQHPFLSLPFPGWQLYRPVGLLNNHLTYGELLAMVLPFLLYKTLRSLGFFRIVLALGTLTSLFLLLANGARSAMIGAFIGVTLIVGAELRIFHSRRRLHFVALSIFLAMLLLPTILIFNLSENQSGESNRLFQTFRHTDHQRTVVWNLAGDLFLEHPLFGTGPGNFPGEAIKWKEQIVQDYPETLYWIRNTPHKHAHNDLLHYLAISGLPGGILFLFLLFTIVSAFFRTLNDAPLQSALLAGGIVFFYSGLAQCYFLDDESVQFFWVLISLGTASRTSRRDS